MKTFIIESSTITPVSLNAAFATLKNGRRVRSKAYVVFARQMAVLTRSLSFEFKAFESHFDIKLHEIHASLDLGVSGLYTKSGGISKTSGDLANYEKTITDCVLTGRIDDAYITKWEMRKFDSPTTFFRLTLTICDR